MIQKNIAIFTIFSIITFLSSCTHKQTVIYDFNNKYHINTNTNDIIESLTEKGFALLDKNSNILNEKIESFLEEKSTKNSLHLYYPKNDIYNVNIYSTLYLTKSYALVIGILVNENTVEKFTTTSTYNKTIAQNELAKLQNIFSILECSNDKDFLKNGFICENNYKVKYKIYQSSLDSLRKILKIPTTESILVIIEGINDN